MEAGQIVEDIKYLQSGYSIDAVHFFDNNFFVDKNRALKFADLLKRNQINLKWDGTTVVDQFLSFTDSDIENLTSSGMYRVILGIESGDEEVLININKRQMCIRDRL